MTLGRTSDNKIKIKTDEAGGGLRAVECACCGGVCGCASVSATLKAIIESATQITVNGESDTWNGTQSQKQLVFGEASWVISYSSGIICVLGDNGDQTVKLSSSEQECTFGMGGDFGNFVTINGQGFTAVQAFPFSPLVLNITFS